MHQYLDIPDLRLLLQRGCQGRSSGAAPSLGTGRSSRCPHRGQPASRFYFQSNADFCACAACTSELTYSQWQKPACRPRFPSVGLPLPLPCPGSRRSPAVRSRRCLPPPWRRCFAAASQCPRPPPCPPRALAKNLGKNPRRRAPGRSPGKEPREGAPGKSGGPGPAGPARSPGNGRAGDRLHSSGIASRRGSATSSAGPKPRCYDLLSMPVLLWNLLSMSLSCK